MMMFGTTSRSFYKYASRNSGGNNQCVVPGLVVVVTAAASSFLSETRHDKSNHHNPVKNSQQKGSDHRRWSNRGLNSTIYAINSSTVIPSLRHGLPVTYCDTAVKGMNQDHEQPLSHEEEDFLDTLSLYRRWLKEIKKQWEISSPASIKWPSNIPQASDISALEVDHQMYLKGGQDDSRLRQDLEFRIAAYYLFREDSVEKQRKGFNMVKKLAVEGHPDGKCLYAMVWNHGGVAGIEAQPHLAVKYWRQAADDGHLASMYELAVALYMGDGAVEDPKQAVQYFKKAADLGHSGAAYLLADCYLDGVGVERSRAKALEWLMTAAEMGHRQAQRRAEALLTDSSSGSSSGTSAKSNKKGINNKLEEEEIIRWGGETRPSDWYRSVSLERRFTIGGGSRNPLILFRRKTAVAESRRSES